MRKSEQIQKQIERLQIRKRELVAERLAANSERVSVLDGELDEADKQLATLRANVTDALDLESLDDFQERYPDLCKQIAEADTQRQALMACLDEKAGEFGRLSLRLKGPKSAVARSTANYCSRACTKIAEYLSAAGVYFDAMRDLEAKRGEL